MKSLLLRFRDHRHFLIIIPLLIIVMTWPLAQNVLDLSKTHLTPAIGDVLIRFWDIWYGELLLAGKADYFYTDLLFHPHGMSLAGHQLGIPHMLVFGALQALLPAANAYYLTYLITIFFNALAAYILLLRLFHNKWIAIAGAVIFGFSPYFFSHMIHEDHTVVATIPLALYAFHRGIVEHRWTWLVAAGALVGFTIFIMMYTFACLLITMAVYTLYLATTRWRNRRFWAGLALTLLVASIISFIRLYPIVADASVFSMVLEKNTGGPRTSDLLTFIVNNQHPITPTIFNSLLNRAPPEVPPDGYLGLAPLLLILAGFIRSRHRREMAPWLLLAAFFASLRLGHFLTIDGIVYSNIPMPKFYLDNLVPWLTKPFWDTAFFQIGILLPLAMLSCYALKTLLDLLPRNLRPAAILFFIALVAFEYYQPPQLVFQQYEESYPWIDWLASEDDHGDIRLINLPMGRYTAKHYLYHQTFHGYPIVEGLASRTPEAAYDYIKSNPLLNHWTAYKTLHCLPNDRDNFVAAQLELLADGFTHIVFHIDIGRSQLIAPNFVNIPAAYEDEQVIIYRVADLDQSCNMTAFLHQDALLSLNSVNETAVLPLESFSIISLQPYGASPDDALDTSSAILYNSRGFMTFDENDIRRELARAAEEPSSALKTNNAILLVYNPSAANPDIVALYRAWLASSFTNCGRVADSETAVIEYFLRPGFPCQLALDDAPLTIHYDNGIQLGNLLASLNEGKLDLQLLWKRLPSETHAISFQFFNAAGAKIHNQDFVFHHDPLGRYQIDLSSLESGTYGARLIVYNYDTGNSLPGLLPSSQTRFDRELEFFQFRIAS